MVEGMSFFGKAFPARAWGGFAPKRRGGAHRAAVFCAALLIAVTATAAVVLLAPPGTGECAVVGGTGGWADTRGPGNGGAEALLCVASRGELYRGTNRGVWAYDEGAGTWSPTGGGLAEYNVYSLTWDGSGLYAGTGDDVWRYDPASLLWTNMDHAGGISLAWTGSALYSGSESNGLWHYDGASGWAPAAAALSNASCRALAWDGSRLYIGIHQQWPSIPFRGLTPGL